MKITNFIKKSFLLPLAIIMVITSCQNEIIEETGLQEILVENIELKNAIEGNNFVGARGCFRPQLPITVIANEKEVFIKKNKDFKIIRNIFNESDIDEDYLEIIFPITIRKGNKRTVVDSQEGLDAIIAECALDDDEDDEDDDDIDVFGGEDCFRVNLPASVTANGIEVILETNRDYKAVRDILNDSDTDVDVIEIAFPITIRQGNIETMIDSQASLDSIIAECALNDDGGDPDPNGELGL